MITLTGIYAAVDASTNEPIIKFAGQIDNYTLLDSERIKHPDEFYREIGKLLIDQFNNAENWI
jgi:hypothetical protein